MRLRWFLLTAGCLLLAVSAAAQAREFWGSNLPSITIQTGTLIFTNTGTTAGTADVYDRTGLVATVPVPPLASTSYTMAPVVTGTGVKTTGAFLINATDGIYVTEFMPITDVFSNDAFRLLNDAELGTDHFVFSFIGSPPAFVTVVATQANTSVTVTPSVAVTGGGTVPAIPAGTPYTVTLGAFDILNLEAQEDLTGTRVVSTAPVAVYSGARCTVIGNSACDHISEQIYPHAYAAPEYPVCASQYMRGGAGYDALRIMATSPGVTTVTVGPVGTVLNLAGPGAWAQVDITDDAFVSATQPVLVAQYYGDSNQNGDPAYILLNPAAAYKAETAVHMPVGWTDYVIIAAPTGTASTMDGVPVGGWRTIPGTAYQCSTQLAVDGDHFLTHSQNASVQALGIGFATSYWYLADVGLDAPPLPPPPPSCMASATAPGAPQNLAAVRTPPTGMAVQLDWDPPLSDGGCPLVGYEVHREEGGPPSVLVATLAAVPPALPPDTYTDTMTDTCETYRWAVRAWTNFSFGPFTPWQDVVTGTVPQPPTPDVVAADGGLRLRWTPADDGGCPVTQYHVEGVSGLDGRIDRTFLPPTQSVDLEHDLCYAFSYRVEARNVRGPSGWSATATYRPDFDRLPHCRPESGEQSDQDGDGVPDGHDNCPAAANPDQGLGPDGACPADDAEEPAPPTGSCEATGGVDEVVAEPGDDGTVRVRWRNPRVCEPAQVTVWDDGRLVAQAAVEAGEQTVLDTVPTPDTHLYFVQLDPAGTPAVFVEASGVPSNWIELCAPQPLLAACPREARPDPTPSAAPPTDPLPSTPPPEPTGRDRAGMPALLTGGLGLLALAALGLAAVLLLRRRRPPGPLGPPGKD